MSDCIPKNIKVWMLCHKMRVWSFQTILSIKDARYCCYKLIQLKDPTNYLSKLSDISSNPKNLQFIEVEGPQTARAIDDVDLAFGYPHYLRLAKTADPESALVLDDTTNKRYAILFVVRDDYQDKGDKLKKFVEIYQTSPAVKAALNEDLGPKLWFPGWV